MRRRIEKQILTRTSSGGINEYSRSIEDQFIRRNGKHDRRIPLGPDYKSLVENVIKRNPSNFLGGEQDDTLNSIRLKMVSVCYVKSCG
ncbi:hypothetical protein TNCV_4628531 [Trichonephila clavipes]|nr:hypothetical protein TNCV_4628531 [Trichonephila clavipes]